MKYSLCINEPGHLNNIKSQVIGTPFLMMTLTSVAIENMPRSQQKRPEAGEVLDGITSGYQLVSIHQHRLDLDCQHCQDLQSTERLTW